MVDSAFGFADAGGSSGSSLMSSVVLAAVVWRALLTLRAAECGRYCMAESWPGAGGVDGEVDYVVVDEDGREIEFVAEVEGLKETVVDDDVAGNLLDAGGGDLFGESGISGEGIGLGEVGVAECVGFVVVPVADGDGAVGVGAAAHGEVA